MKRRIKTALLGIVLFTSTMVAETSAQQYTDLLYRGPGSWTPAPRSDVAVPSQEFLRGTQVPDRLAGLNISGYQPVHGGWDPSLRNQIQNGIPVQQLPGRNPVNQFQGQPTNRRPRSFQSPQPQNLHLLHYTEQNNIVGGTYDDGRGGSAHGSIGTVGESNLNLVGESDFAGLRGGVRGGLGAQGHVEQKYDINGLPLRNYSSGETFLGTEAQAQAGLSPEGLGGGVGGFSGLRAQATSGFDAGVVDVAGTVEGRVGIGAEANANIGLQDGRFRIKGEVGAALGIGGKVGVDTEVDLGDTGRFIEKTGNGAIRTVKKSAQDVDRWGQQAGKDINRTTKTVSNDVKRTANKVGGDIKNFGKSIFGK